MQDEYRLAVVAIDDRARWLNDLSVARPLELDQLAPALGVIFQLADVLEYAGNKHCRRGRILQRDVVADSVKIATSRTASTLNSLVNILRFAICHLWFHHHT